MIKFASSIRRMGLKLLVPALLALPELAGAQIFQYIQTGDVLAGFRKTGVNDTTDNELVSDLGSVTNYLKLPAGTTITITNFTAAQLTYAFANYNNLQWSVFATFPAGGLGFTWKTPLGNFPNATYWLTLPDTSTTIQTTPPNRAAAASQSPQSKAMLGVGEGAASISGFSSESIYNTNSAEVEPESYSQYDLTSQIGDESNPALGDFGSGGSPLPYTVENTTPASFSGSQRDDFYQLVPSNETDPILGGTGTSPYYVGYFLLNSSGKMTFFRAFALTASVTNGSSPLTVVFSSTATNSASITNWVWNFGNGTIITNTTDANVTNIFTTAGTYTVTLTTYGPGGSGSVSTSVVVSSSAPPAQPLISIAVSAGQFVISGTNGPASQQYRILSSTSILTPLSGWKPVYTNTFASNGTFTYTNSGGNGQAFFIVVSP